MKLVWHLSKRHLPVPFIGLNKMPANLVGICLGPVVVLRASALTDLPTRAHEIEHCRQFWQGGLLLHFLRYWLSQHYRLKCELKAFAAEITASRDAEKPWRQEEAARAISACYRLAVTESEARDLIRLELTKHINSV